MPFKPYSPFSINDTELSTWFERDRAHIELRNLNTGKTILEFWDEEVGEAFEDGFLDSRCFVMGKLVRPRDLHVELYKLAHERGLLSEKAQKA